MWTATGCVTKDVEHMREINTLRNTVFHGRDIEGAKFQGKSIFEEETIARIFHVAQEVGFNLRTFSEMLDAPHAYAERDAKELAELKHKTFVGPLACDAEVRLTERWL